MNAPEFMNVSDIAFEPPAELDLETYRRNNPDVAELDDVNLTEHFRVHGRYEGRMASVANTREGFVASIPRNGACLELGPFCNPLLRGDTVKYFDVLDQPGLKQRAGQLGLDGSNCPYIDYVSPTGDLLTVSEKFDVIFSSHTIEHQPNLVKHLQDVASRLTDSGRYYLLIPDKRYCFDHFLPESTIARVLAAEVEQRQIHSPQSFFEHRLLLTNNDPGRHWNGDHAGQAGDRLQEKIRASLHEWRVNGSHYIDVHAWQFTPDSFRDIITTLNVAGMTDLSVERIYSTIRGSIEFAAVLHKS